MRRWEMLELGQQLSPHQPTTDPLHQLSQDCVVFLDEIHIQPGGSELGRIRNDRQGIGDARDPGQEPIQLRW